MVLDLHLEKAKYFTKKSSVWDIKTINWLWLKDNAHNFSISCIKHMSNPQVLSPLSTFYPLFNLTRFHISQTVCLILKFWLDIIFNGWGLFLLSRFVKSNNEIWLFKNSSENVSFLQKKLIHSKTSWARSAGSPLMTW